MKCFYHQNVDAVGTCTNCGKAGCSECLQDVGGALLCNSCWEVEAQAELQELQKESGKAKKRMIGSYLFSVLGVIFGISIGFGNPNIQSFFSKLLLTGFVIYSFWSFYWGYVGIRPWLKRQRSKFNFLLILPIMGWVFVIFMYVGLVIELAFFYGFFGGGVYQYLKNKRFIEEMAQYELPETQPA